MADVDPEVSGHAADVEKGRQVGGGGVPEPGCVAPGSGRARHTRTLPNDARESGDRRPVSAPSGRSASALTTSQGLRPTPAGSDRRPHAPAPFSTTGTSPRVPRRGTCTGACPGEAASTTPGPGFNDADVTVRGFNDAFEVVGQCRWRTPRIRPTPNTTVQRRVLVTVEPRGPHSQLLQRTGPAVTIRSGLGRSTSRGHDATRPNIVGAGPRVCCRSRRLGDLVRLRGPPRGRVFGGATPGYTQSRWYILPW